jgi:hypothetical protein
MRKLLLFLLFLPLLLTGDEKKYNQQVIINIWGKTAKEINIIKTDIERTAQKYGLDVILQNIPEIDVKWQKVKNQSQGQR